MEQHFLLPGTFLLATEPTIITTVLGSCLACSIYDPGRRIGALSHSLFAHCPSFSTCGAVASVACDDCYKYVDATIERMLACFSALGCAEDALQIKLFGGAEILGLARSSMSVGAQNCKAAFSILENKGLTVLAYDVGGCFGRKIALHTNTGKVIVKTLRRRS